MPFEERLPHRPGRPRIDHHAWATSLHVTRCCRHPPGEAAIETLIDVELPRGIEAATLAGERLMEVGGALSPPRLIEARLFASELVANALMHAPPDGEVRLVVGLGPDRVRIEVHDVGRGFERPPSIPGPPSWRTSGRGLFLVDQLAERWGNAHTRTGHCVWVEVGRT